ncbi:hypothetical protein FACS1894190_00720 [Spirochaetia bacterium]|nr:hypothetical protein FACS1894190_00720 [Spirochaetia bacterium]
MGFVYLSKSGSKYHLENCSTLKDTKIKTKLTDAITAGKSPCSVCNPPLLKEIEKSKIYSQQNIYRVNMESLKSYANADITRMLPAKVIRHIDGDTVELQFENPPSIIKKTEKIRMIGVDTPETLHPKKEVQYFGKEASDFTKKRLLNKDVFIALDWDTRDKYDRLLAYIYMNDGSCHNAELIKNGFAAAYTHFPFQFLDEFRLLEKQAKAGNRGLWGGNRQESKKQG